MGKLRLRLVLLLVLSVVAALLALPREDVVFKTVGIDQSLSVRRGLDLQGGAYLIYEADLSETGSQSQEEVLNNLANVIERRVNPTGTSEAIVQTAAEGRIVVQIPGVEDVEAAKNLIGQTAQLRFYEVPQDAESFADFAPTDVTGQDVARATVDFMPPTGEPIVRLQLQGGESTRKFADLTARLSQTGILLATLLDQSIIFGPARTEAIPNGEATLQGDFTVQDANEIASLINAGALPVPVELVSERTVGPTLGEAAANDSVVAALIGLGSVALFLIFYYRLPGLVAAGALGIYTAITLSIYKISALTPYTIVLTLAGIAGFILSVAMAADANILILERLREEARRGINVKEALEDGFKFAWSSIRDANVATLISAVILYQFGGTPLIKGFAVTLGLGVVISLFSALFISKTLLRVLVRSRFNSPALLGLDKEVE